MPTDDFPVNSLSSWRLLSFKSLNEFYDYRDVLEPLVEYISHANNVEFANQLTTVVIPEFVSSALPAQLLHNQTANILRWRLRTLEDLVIIDVPYLIKSVKVEVLQPAYVGQAPDTQPV